MGCGYDYDYLLPQGALPRFLEHMASVWPSWRAELEGGKLLQSDAFDGQMPPGAERGFVLYRDVAMRERFHAEGAFVDEDGSSPINVFLVGWDDALVQADFVIDLRPPSPFLARALESVARAIADKVMQVERVETCMRYRIQMDLEWARKSWPVITKLELAHTPSALFKSDAQGLTVLEFEDADRLDPDRAATLERCVLLLLGYWHRIVYTGNAGQRCTMPPGDLIDREGVVDILPNGKPMNCMASPPRLV